MRTVHLLLWVAILLCNTLLSHTTMAGALDNWHVRISGSNNFSDLIWANDLFVAVGHNPIITSPDGVTWTPRPSGIANLPRGIAYGNGRFVVVAAGGTNLTSTNGLDWTPGPSGTPSALWNVAFGNGQFVAVGGTTLLTSPDGLNWTARDSQGVGGFEVKFGDGKFFVRSGTSKSLLSSDGVNWTPLELPESSNLYCTGFGNGTWVIVNTRNNLWTSRDAVNWTSRGRVEIQRPSEILYAYGTWIMVGGKILSSRDGITWTERLPVLFAGGRPFFTVAAGRHTFVTAGYQLMVQSDPVLNIELRRESPRELILSGPLGRTARIEFSESGAGDWRPLETVTLDSDPYVWPVELGPATGFYRAMFLE